MKQLTIAFILVILGHQICISADAQKEKMKWWDEAKFGMFIHFGVYSSLAGEWKGQSKGSYSEHIFRTCKIPLETYKNEVAANFNPVKFDAEEWVKLCKDAGVKYMVITSKHHDGFAMYDSHVKGWSDYDIVDGTKFKRDIMVELKKACDKYGIRFGFYYSHAQDWSHKYGQRNTWDYNHPTKKGDWYNLPEWQEHRKNSIHYVQEKSIPQLKEILSEKYDPDIIWFDTSSWLPDEYLQMILKAGREAAKPKVIFNSRSAKGYADYKSTCDRPVEFFPVEGYWEAIPTTNNSYGYFKQDKSHKPASHFIRLISKATARGGNILMNLGPKGDGSIDETDAEIFRGIGAWLKVNGEAIYGTKRTPLPVHAWGQSTVKGNRLYLHIHNYPADNSLPLTKIDNEIQKAYMLSDSRKKALNVEKDKDGDITINLPEHQPDSVVSVVVLECKKEIDCNSKRLVSTTQNNTFHVFDGKLTGNKIKYGRGAERDNYLYNWKDKDDFVKWENRIKTTGKFNVYMIYDSEKNCGDNQYEVIIGNKIIKKNVEPEAGFKKIKVGTVTLEKGNADIKVRVVNLATTQLMKLREVILEPVG